MEKLAVVAFGRMSPVTVGHRKLVLQLKEVAEARGGDAFLFLSSSYDGLANSQGQREKCPRNPLKYEDKLFFAQDAFGELVTVVEEPHRDIFAALATLEKQGYSAVVLLGDEAFLAAPVEKYNGKNYHFSSFEKLTGGVRDEDSSDFLEQVSATQARQAVMKGDYSTFATMAATRRETRRLWHTLRRELGCES